MRSCGALPREPRCTLEARPAHPRAFRGIGAHLDDRPGDRFASSGSTYRAASPADLPHDREVGADHGAAARHRLERREAEPLEERREDQRRRLGVEPLQLRRLDPAAEVHPAPEAQPVDDRRERILAVAARDDQSRPPRFGDAGERLEEAIEVLVRHPVAHREQQVVTSRPRRRPAPAPRRSRERHHVDALRGDAEQAHHVVARRRAHREDAAGHAGRAPDHRPEDRGVGARHVLRMPEGEQVVHGEHHGHAWGTPARSSPGSARPLRRCAASGPADREELPARPRDTVLAADARRDESAGEPGRARLRELGSRQARRTQLRVVGGEAEYTSRT